MRLLPEEVQTIKQTLNQHSPRGNIYLHGSRIEDDKKGGDIDLFLVVPNKEYDEIIQIKHVIAAELSQKLREQKIDLIILSEDESGTHDFFKNSDKVPF